MYLPIAFLNGCSFFAESIFIFYTVSAKYIEKNYITITCCVKSITMYKDIETEYNNQCIKLCCLTLYKV